MIDSTTQRRTVLRASLLVGALGSIAFLPSCGPSLSATNVGLRNCVEQEATADGRLSCMKRVTPQAGEPAKCSEGRAYGSELSYQPIDDKRRDDLQKDVKYLRHEAWEAVADAPFQYDVDWAGSLVGAENNNAMEWIRGALHGRDATLSLGTSPDTRALIDMSVQRDGKLIEDFVTDAPAAMVREAAEGLGKLSARLEALSGEVHELFSGFYMGLNKINATTSCYHDFAAAEQRMQVSISKFRETIEASRKRLDERFGTRSSEEAEQLRKDREAWKKAEAASCGAPKKASDCDGVDAYLAEFPRGERAEEAKKLLASVASTIGPLRDEAAWKNARVAECQRPKSSDACDGVKAYLESYPQGIHAEEASRMMRLKRGALVQLAALEEQRRRIAAVRAVQTCIQTCAKSLRACQSECRKGAPDSLLSCQRSCLETFKGTCVPACKK
jgi:TolA-binding protein